MLINSRHFIVIAVAALMMTACGEDDTPSSTASKAPQEAAEITTVTPAETPPATTPAQESTEPTGEPAISPAMRKPVPAEALSHPVVYQEEIYKNWPYTETPPPAMEAPELVPQPAAALSHPVVYQDEIYKNWPYTSPPPPTTETGVTEAVESQMESVMAGMEEKVESAATTVEETVAAATTAAAGLSPQTQVESAATAVEETVTTVTTAAAGPSPQAAAGGAAQTHTINAEARVFNPDIVYIQPGDTVSWINMTSHNSVSIDGLIPAGATPWRGQLGENLKVTLTVEGIYGYVCEPHIGFGMIGVIVVGKPQDLEEVKAYADKNMQGPFRRIIGKLNKVTVQ